MSIERFTGPTRQPPGVDLTKQSIEGVGGRIPNTVVLPVVWRDAQATQELTVFLAGTRLDKIKTVAERLGRVPDDIANCILKGAIDNLSVDGLETCARIYEREKSR